MNTGPGEWLVVLGVVVLLFGAKKLPDLARSVGQSTRVLKGEMRGLKEDEQAAKPADSTPPAVAAPAPAPAEQGTTARTEAA